MMIVFYIAAVIAVAATVMTITLTHAVHALLYLIVSLLAVAVIFYTLGAPFAAALEAITYAGAIMVLFVFVVMMLNLGEAAVEQERRWLDRRMWGGPALLAAALLAELVYTFAFGIGPGGPSGGGVSPHAVGAALFGPYLLAVEIAGFLLLAALVGAYHLGRRRTDADE
ncbi:MAG: NADH-quinone oxidoreductase subunit J [Nitrococcus sp.]|nr:NADH-quinone oxidoreductase subunit J [Nitrococcus sp.]